MVKLYLYLDLMSQPARSVLGFCLLNKIEHEIIDVYISKGMNRGEDYLKINPHGEIPAIKLVEDDGKEFILYESCTILRFLSYYYKTDEHWYNRQDIKRRALIDQYLDWHHSNTRKNLAPYFFNNFAIPKFLEFGIKVPKVYHDEKEMNIVLKYLDWRLKNPKYIVDDTISIADLMLYNELIELLPTKFEYNNYPNISKYIDVISDNSEIKKANSVLKKACEKSGVKTKF